MYNISKSKANNDLILPEHKNLSFASDSLNLKAAWQLWKYTFSLTYSFLQQKYKEHHYMPATQVHELRSVQFSSVAQSCPILFDPMGSTTPGFPVHHQLPELAQAHVYQVGDAIQPSHLLSCPSPPTTFNLSQHQDLFQWVSSSNQVAKVLEFQLQHRSFQWIFRTDLLPDGLVEPPCSPRDSQESSPTPQFKGISSSVLSFL